MTKQSYNFMALRGANITDDEYAELGAPAEYLYTPKMIEWHVEDMNAANLELYRSQMSEEEAQRKMKQQEAIARKSYQKLLAQNGLLKK